MLPRRFVVALAIFAALACLVIATAADLTPDAAYARVVRAPLSRDPLPKPDELAAARKVLEAQTAREPREPRWVYALAHIANAEAEQATGDTQKDKRKEALERFEHAAELAPGNADYQFWIAQFYVDAPGMAGGSVEKAKAQGGALVALPERRGEFQGRMVLAGIAAHEEHWEEMSRQFTAAETAKGDGADPVVAMRSHAWSLLNRKKDPQAALPVVSRYVKAAPADDVTAWFLDGEVKRQLGHCADALPRYDQVLAKRAEARGSRWGAAVCREQLGQKDAALRDYEEYARRFPEDDRAKEAKAAIKRLQ